MMKKYPYFTVLGLSIVLGLTALISACTLDLGGAAGGGDDTPTDTPLVDVTTEVPTETPIDIPTDVKNNIIYSPGI